MLIPNRFSNLKFSLVNVTAITIDYLIQERKASLPGILSHLNNFSKEFTREDVMQSVSFLFALGKIDYIEGKDEVILMDASITRKAESA